jgi:hypothetical protein
MAKNGPLLVEIRLTIDLNTNVRLKKVCKRYSTTSQLKGCQTIYQFPSLIIQDNRRIVWTSLLPLLLLSSIGQLDPSKPVSNCPRGRYYLICWIAHAWDEAKSERRDASLSCKRLQYTFWLTGTSFLERLRRCQAASLRKSNELQWTTMPAHPTSSNNTSMRIT